MPAAKDATTMLCTHMRDGSAAASSNAELLTLVYDELRKLAAHYLKRERSGHTLQPTALAHEAYLRMIDQSRADWECKAHFMAMAAEMIRRILVDHARIHKAQKRGGGQKPADLNDDVESAHQGAESVDLIALDEALSQLGQRSERQLRVVELRFFGGLGVEETAHVLNISPATVKDDWRLARAWLRDRLES